MSDPIPPWHPAPASVAERPPPPVPGSPAARAAQLNAARAAGLKVGEVHGQFKAWAENFLDLFTSTGATGGISLWERLPPQRRLEAIAKVQYAYAGLPVLPPAASVEEAAALRSGFADGAKSSYESDQVANRAVWVACELAKSLALGKAATPSATAIAGFADRFSDCAAQTASRAILEMTGVEVEAAFLVRTFGLPRTSISGYESAVAFARNWFTSIGFQLATKNGGLAPIASGGVAGRYAVFLKGGASGGHVVFADLSPAGLRIVDSQLGVVWTSLAQAERTLGMQVTTVSRIESITLAQ